MSSDTSNPFYDSSDRKYRRNTNSRSFWDDDQAGLEPTNPFATNQNSSGRVYKRGGHGTEQNSTRQELLGSENDQGMNKHHFNEEDDDFDVDAPFDAEAYRQKMLLKKIRESTNRQIDSQKRALNCLDDSERIGIETAEELMRQGEQLDNVEKKTADINNTMKTSEQYVNKLGSIFGGMKGWFRKKEQDDKPDPAGQRDSRLRETVEAYKSTATPVDHSNHPAVRLRDQDRLAASRDRPGPEPAQTTRQAFKQYDDQFNSNLDVMSDGLARLKGLGMVMQTEIDAQNDQIERINVGVARADDKLVDQTKRMNRILKK